MTKAQKYAVRKNNKRVMRAAQQAKEKHVQRVRAYVPVIGNCLLPQLLLVGLR